MFRYILKTDKDSLPDSTTTNNNTKYNGQIIITPITVDLYKLTLTYFHFLVIFYNL